MKTVAFFYDCHLEDSDSKTDVSYKVAKRFLKTLKPDELILGGDFMDCKPLSHWIYDKKRKLENLRWQKDCDFANKELDYLQKYAKKVTYLEGNHEDWVNQYLDSHPEMEGTIEVPIKLRLKERKIDFYKYNEFYKLGKLYATHGVYTGKYHAHKHLITYGASVVYGHTHHPQVEMLNMKFIEPHKAWCLGCLCGHAPEYMRGKHANWMNGFAIAYVDEKTGNFNMYPIDIIEGRFIWNGKLYK